jgi:hypothetical protein
MRQLSLPLLHIAVKLIRFLQKPANKLAQLSLMHLQFGKLLPLVTKQLFDAC